MVLSRRAGEQLFRAVTITVEMPALSYCRLPAGGETKKTALVNFYHLHCFVTCFT